MPARAVALVNVIVAVVVALAATACDGARPPPARAAAQLPSFDAHQEGVALDGGLVTRGIGGDCLPCHADIDAQYRTSGMRESLTLPTGAGSVEASLVGTSHSDPATGITAHFGVRGGRYVQRIVYVDPAGVERAAYEMPVDLVIGSGHATRSYLAVREGRMFELPLTWYRETGALALSPGGHFRAAAAARVYQQCIECHTGDVAPAGGRVPSRFTGEISLGITCRRCHGDAPEHVRTKAPADVVHPGLLDLERQEELCAQCHLAGAVAVVRPGKSVSRDYRPGTRLGEVIGVFVESEPDASAAAGTSIAGHAERLRMSPCSTESGSGGRPALVCTTCHDPHEGHRAELGPADLVGGCGVCHRVADCGAPQAQREGRRCATCHMAVLPSNDIAHTKTTDHFIQARPANLAADPRPPEERSLGALAAADRALVDALDPDGTLPGAGTLAAAAYLEGSTFARAILGRPAPGYVARAERLLAEALRVDPGDREASWLRALARLEAGDAAGGAEAIREHIVRLGADPDAAVYRAWALLAAGRTDDAAVEARPLVEADPYESLATTVLASAEIARGRPSSAVTALVALRERLGPSIEVARLLMDAAGRAGDAERALAAAYDVLMFRPRDADALSEAAHLAAFLAKDTAQARVLFREALRLAPEHVSSLVGLARVEDAAGDAAAARALAARADRLRPGIAEVRAILAR